MPPTRASLFTPDKATPHPIKEQYHAIPTPVNVEKLSMLLKGYTQYDYLVNGFKNGFALHYEGPNQIDYHLPNNKSVIENKDIVYMKIAKEIELGRTEGGFINKPWDNFVVSPLSLVPKKEPGEYRIIHDLSQPKGFSINSFINDENASVKYDTFDSVTDLIIKCGPRALISKCDIKDAFRIIPVRPEDYHLLGFYLEPYYYYEKVLPMGCRSSCRIFESFSRGLRYIMNKIYTFSNITGILDDFIMVGPEQSFECMRGLIAFKTMTKILNVPLKKSKLILPTTCTDIFGIEVDTVKMQLRLPKDKIEKALALIHIFLSQNDVILRELLRLLGLLNFCCKCVRPGRAFLRRLWDLTRIPFNKKSLSARVKLTDPAKQDLLAWQLFLKGFNGTSLLLKQIWITSSHLHLHTDSSKSVGYGCTFNDSWFHGVWSDELKQLNIVILELIPIIMAIYMFSDMLSNKCVVFHTDNLALTQIINQKTSKCSITMCLVRKMVVKTLVNNINIRAQFIPGSKNVICDMLSRLKVQEAKQNAPWLNPTPMPIPQHLRPSLLLRPF